MSLCPALVLDEVLRRAGQGALRRGEVGPIRWAMQRTPPIPSDCQWCMFLRNHDELTLEMVTPEQRAAMYGWYAPDPRMRANVGIRRRLAPLLEKDKEMIDLSLQRAPKNYKKLVRLGSYGSWINQYLCGLSLRVTDLQGRTAVFPWIVQHTGRCSDP